ncbi:sigma-70 family RNA polymerase sigma factor [Methylomonas sp. UP202]|uniref:RNA polymerase sigma factor n=1 Tax=Methylomonas sp. UP202 TaxID=3040943 RepID=UPI0024794D87|nr:sigma-70 family RNA polymerase sigma factor [Methylomonas sp. UP202]WGS85768.1 sigma-70 family RNA polymerase sigma factor [Methylomonas sp. UP202]
MLSRVQFFDSLFRKHNRELFSFIAQRSGQDQAEDLLQDTYLRLLQHSDPQGIENPRAFLYQTGSNLSIDQHRHQTVLDRVYCPVSDFELETALAVDPAPGPEADAALDQEFEKLNTILMELPEITRNVFYLHRLEGLSHKEIAKRLTLSVRNSERHVADATHYLLTKLDSA